MQDDSMRMLPVPTRTSTRAAAYVTSLPLACTGLMRKGLA
jgi:hypothetical protein